MGAQKELGQVNLPCGCIKRLVQVNLLGKTAGSGQTTVWVHKTAGSGQSTVWVHKKSWIRSNYCVRTLCLLGVFVVILNNTTHSSLDRTPRSFRNCLTRESQMFEIQMSSNYRHCIHSCMRYTHTRCSRAQHVEYRSTQQQSAKFLIC